MDLKFDPRSIAGLLWPILLAVLAAFWFSAIKDEVLPEASTNWGVALELTSSEGGEARLYWETEEGITQENSAGLPIEPGKRNELFFPLPKDAEIKGFRLDPVDRAETQAKITIHRAEAVGPRGYWFGKKPGIKEIKPRLDTEGEDSREFPAEFGVTGADPQLRLSVNSPPLTAPEAEFAKAAKVVWWLAFAVCAIVFLAIQLAPKAKPIALYLAGLSWAVYLICYFLLPIKEIDPIWFYSVVFGPSLFLCLLSAPELWSRVKPLLTHPPMWALAAFVLYFGISATGLSAESEPARGVVLMNLGFLLIAPALFLFLRDFFRFDEPWTRFVWIGVATVVAAYMLIGMYGGGLPFSMRLYQYIAITPAGSDIDHFTPLHRTISGSAVFAMALLLGLSWADRRERSCDRGDWRWLTICVVIAAPIMFYILFSQSRSVVLGLLAALGILAVARRARVSRLVGAVFLFFAALFYFNLPDKLDRITKRGAYESAAAEAAAQADDSNPTKGGMQGRSTSGRVDIWKVYLAEIAKKPVFGEGLGGRQRLLVELDESLFAPQDAHLARREWNPHSVHLSVLYFGGIVGFLIHASLLGSILFFAWIRFRKTGNGAFLLSAAWLALAAISVAFESSLIAEDKVAVLLRYPNEYWIFYWGAIIFGVIQTALPDLKPSGSNEDG